jgi:hypothetical protein
LALAERERKRLTYDIVFIWSHIVMNEWMNECSPFSLTLVPNIHSSMCGGTSVNFFFLLFLVSSLFFGATFPILGFQLAINFLQGFSCHSDSSVGC